MTDRAKRLLTYLCDQYDKLSSEFPSRAFPEFSETIKHPDGYCYVRCSMGDQRFSIVMVNFDPAVRGQGVLVDFIDYIKANPYHYRGVEVAIIENKRLAERLLADGWRHRSLMAKWFGSKKPTLVCDFVLPEHQEEKSPALGEAWKFMDC